MEFIRICICTAICCHSTTHPITTPQVTWENFTCITIFQIYIFLAHKRQHSSSDSKMVGCHHLCILPILINKQDLAGIQITIYIYLSSHQTPIPNYPQQKKTMNHSQEKYEFILLKMKLFLPPSHQNYMSSSLHT